MKYATVCSGIEAPGEAWPEWEPVFFSEIAPFPCSVLKQRFPNVPNYGDMTKYKGWPNESIKLICAGTPCQAFSVAGFRKGLADPRGNLTIIFLTIIFLGIIERYKPDWLVWENVPGILSDQTGAFGAFLGGLAQLGYGFAYRILDAQYFGIPQRRRRLFVVGHSRNWRYSAAVLFERQSLQGHSPPRRKKGEGFAADVAPGLTASGRGTRATGGSRGQDPVIAHTLRGEGFDAMEDGTGRETPLIAFHGSQDPDSSGKITHPLGRNSGRECCIAIQSTNTGKNKKQHGVGISKDDIMYSLTARDLHGVQTGSQVRRLTPKECERLQGFKDYYTLINYNGKPVKDGPRYKALGNAMAVPVMKWIGKRIEAVEKTIEELN